MTTDLLKQLADYGAYHDEEQGTVSVAQIVEVAGSPVSATDAQHPTLTVTLDQLQLSPLGSHTPPRRKRWSVVVVAAAATVLVVVGVLVVASGNRVSDPVASPSGADPALSPGLTDPVEYSWSLAPPSEAVVSGASAQWMKSVTVGGPGLVAVGSVGNDGDADAAVWTSVDGITWSRVPHDEAVFGGAGGQWMNSVTAGGPGLVAVGSDGRFSQGYRKAADGWYQWGEQNGAAAVWTSVDGITWSRVPYDETVFGVSADQEMNSVTAGGPGLVAVGSVKSGDEADAAVWTSVDGLTWSRAPQDEAVLGGPGAQEMNSLIAAGPGLVAVGVAAGQMTVDEGQVDWLAKAAVWTSVDGITWSRAPHDEATFEVTGTQRMNSVVAVGQSLVAVGTDQHGDDVPSGRAIDAAVWVSVDGITWSRIPHDAAVFGGTGNQRMKSVTATDAGLVAVGADGGFYDTRPDAVVWTSVDGVTWSRVPHDEAVFGGAEMHSLAVTDAGLVAVGDQSLESLGTAERQEAIESGDSVFAWVAKPEN